jgi:hypothetical protein
MIRRSVVRGAARAFAFAILAAVRVPAADCNGNGLDDGEEIATGAVSDCNGNGVPDPCDLMPSPFALAEVRRHEVLDTVRSLTTGDLDADGLPDVIAAVRDVLGLAVFKGDAGEGLTAFPPSGLFFDPAWVVVADANRDGKADLITEAAGGLSVHLGLGGGSLASPVRSRGDLGDPVAADITGDGRMDLVATSGGAVGIAAGSGDGLFAPPVLLPAADAPSSIAVADLDLDGRLDIAAASYDASTIALHFARGGGDFRSPISFFTSAGLDPRDAPFAIAATDHDHDGVIAVRLRRPGRRGLRAGAGCRVARAAARSSSRGPGSRWDRGPGVRGKPIGDARCRAG